MYFIYTFFLAVALVVAAPYYLMKIGRYGPSLGDRFGRLRTPQLRGSIWVHAVSVGEVKAVQTLLKRLRAAYPGKAVVISTITLAGHKLACESAGIADHVIYFPFDFPATVRRTLDRIDPEFVIVAETEIWPNFLRACRERRVRVLMVNGRISDRSLPKYRLIRGWLKRVLADYTILGMQSEGDRERIEMLGGDPAKVTVFGNLKYDALAMSKPLDARLAAVLKSLHPLWIAASTKEGEEEFILDAFSKVRKSIPALNLVIAPRHPQRFAEVQGLIQRSGYPCVRRTTLTEEGPNANSASVFLLDSIGELSSTFEYASVVFVGGSLVPLGGHNVLEPASFSKPIVFGPHMENFRDIAQLFLEAHAAIQIKAPGELAGAVARLLTDQRLAAELGGNARHVVERNTGATDRVMAFLQPVEVRR